ncbi:sigma-70 family RNA polymerase sigma factor [Microlunatus ginsengisoli]|uniref:Sigma-70 family RNA polymerase sigma factor n=1 Tax=Microlunatus ginsengisoli TaxID=363863 RepID=A0ABP6ZHS1_9ACTN
MNPETRPDHDSGPEPDDLAGAQQGDAEAFDRLVAPLRPALHAHCYRMLGSAHDADDALQEALLRAWRKIAGFEGRSSLRSWLYSVATRCCLDQLAGRRRRALPMDLSPASERVVTNDVPLSEVSWLGPYPDRLLEDPATRVEERAGIELAFVAALQHLPGNQRAALVLFDVVGFNAAEIATIMDTSVASVNSSLQRARAAVAARIPARSQQETLDDLGDGRRRAVVAAYARALERGDIEALIGLLTADVTWSMPPLPHWYAGLGSVREFARRVPMTCGAWRHRPTSANGQPAVACYLRPAGEDGYRGWAINVLTLRDERIAAITSFIGEDQFRLLGLPVELPPVAAGR